MPLKWEIIYLKLAENLSMSITQVHTTFKENTLDGLKVMTRDISNNYFVRFN